MWPFDSSPTSFGPDTEQFAAGFADPGAQAAAAVAAGQPGTENLNMPGGLGGSNPGLVSALQAASKSSAFNPPASAALAAAKPTEVPAGRPRIAGSLDALAKLLQQRQEQYGGLSGQPIASPRTLGLLGF